MINILVSNLMMIAERERFDDTLKSRGYNPVWADVEQYLDEEACLGYAGDIDGWLAGDDQITEAVLKAALPRLKVVSKWGTGVDSIDLEAAKKLGVPIYNSPGAFAITVAEVALGYMLCLGRGLLSTDRKVRDGEWPKNRTAELYGQTLGMIGYGAIGQRIGELAQAFGMRVIAYDPRLTMIGATYDLVSLETIAEQADFICLACNLNSDNRHIINKSFLNRIKKGAFLINVARGPLVDEQALIGALQKDILGGCALDVFEMEPLQAQHLLKQIKNVILGSHNANNGFLAVETVHGTTLANLEKGLQKYT